MYQRYFGFKERPFRLVPDPTYLFLGSSHREAMAHLSYALDTGDGFATVIGEVGTGKTTLCRSFLESLDADVTSAYIFNPAADPVDLIRSINRDFDLQTDTDDLQDLIESLNRFLLDKKSSGQTVVLVIDEAQNLSRQVLEQIRLLSNLETSRSKLLQIILVGQPELQQTLAAGELRQLRQRITLNCRLRPLSLAETGAYIRHRLAVGAIQTPVEVSPAAIRAIFRFSGGIPRLINTACDRALLSAYGRSRRQIDRVVARQAVAELKNADALPPSSNRVRSLVATALGTALLATAVMVGLNMTTGTDSHPPPPQMSQPSKAARLPVPDATQSRPQEPVTVSAAPPARPHTENPDPAEEAFGDHDPWVMNRSQAVSAILNLWKLSPAAMERTPVDDFAFFQKSAKPLGLTVYRITDRPDLIEVLNLPAILPVSASESSQAGYGVLMGIKDGQYMLTGNATAHTAHPLSPLELNRRWSGTAYVLWNNFYAMTGEIPGKASGETVLTLKLLLRELGYAQVGLGASFDEPTRQAVIDFQVRHGLPADGVVGSLTKIALYNTRPGLEIPRLNIAPGGKMPPSRRKRREQYLKRPKTR